MRVRNIVLPIYIKTGNKERPYYCNYQYLSLGISVTCNYLWLFWIICPIHQKIPQSCSPDEKMFWSLRAVLVVINKMINMNRDRRCSDREFESRSWRGVLDTTLCNKVCQWLATGRPFSPGTPVSSTNKANRHDITEILLKVALNTMTLTLKIKINMWFSINTYPWYPDIRDWHNKKWFQTEIRSWHLHILVFPNALILDIF